MQSWLFWLLLTIVSPGSALAQTGENPGACISARFLREHIEYLGSDALEGRGTGTPGGDEAARYIAQQLDSYDLIPVGDERTYFQRIPMRGCIPLPESKLRLSTGEQEHGFELVQDYLLYKMGAQTFVPNPVPLVFVGYGIVAPEFDYNDYQSVEAEEKIVVLLSGEPVSSDEGYFAGEAKTIHSYPEIKQRVALARGARGSIMIPNPREEAGRDWAFWVTEFSFEHVTLA